MTKSAKAPATKAKDQASAESTSKHPVQHKITLTMSNKESIEIVTTWGKEGQVLKADIDPFNHPAWQDGNKSFVNPNDDNMNKFIKKFGGFSGM
ncbi:MAG: ribosomal protein L31 [Rickettsiales bacterium]|jgi:ribosomal protein L31